MFLGMTATVLAQSTLMTYSGQNIRGKASIQNFMLSSSNSVTLTHTNSNFAYNVPGTNIMTITYQKKNGLFYTNTGYYVNTQGNGTFYYTCTLAAGTYRLYFNTADTGSCADISGNVKG